MKLSEDKQNVLNVLTGFLLNPSQKFMVINGGAGTGKTTLIPELINTFVNANAAIRLINPEVSEVSADDVYLAATTHKALSALPYSKIAGEHKTQLRCTTLHSLLGMTASTDLNGKLVFKPQPAFEFNFDKKRDELLIIDEAGYINEELFKLTKDLLNWHKKLKIIFIGDKRQNKPVGEDVSPVFSNADVYVELTQRFRFPHDGTIHKNSLIVEKAIDSNQDITPFNFDENFKVINTSEYVNLVKKAINSPLFGGTKIIGYTNKKVIETNTQIQLAKYDTPYLIENQAVILNNTHEVRKTGAFSLKGETILTVKHVYATEYDYEHNIRYYRVNFKETSYAFKIAVNPQELKNTLSLLAKQRRWGTFFKLKEQFIDVRQVWAATAHKVQGSTFTDVIIDINDLATAPKEDFKHLLNVAITRAKNKVYIYRDDL